MKYIPIGLIIICIGLLVFLFRELNKPAPGSVTGGVMSASDSTPVDGATITIYNSEGNEVAVATSGPDGKYSGISLTYGPYHGTAIKKNVDGMGAWLQGDVDFVVDAPAVVVDFTLVKTETLKQESKEESEKRECYPFCPGMFSSCFETKCAYYYRFY